MDELDKLIGMQVKARREASMYSQLELADKMRAAGTKWSQATVWSVENGERPLRFSEAVIMSGICGFRISDLMSEDVTPVDVREHVTRGIDLAIRALEALKLGQEPNATDEKVRENKVRRMAQRQGLNLTKSRRRDPRARDFGAYYLHKESEPFDPDCPLTLDEAERAVNA